MNRCTIVSRNSLLPSQCENNVRANWHRCKIATIQFANVVNDNGQEFNLRQYFPFISIIYVQNIYIYVYMLRDTRDMIKRKVIFQIRKWKGKNYYYRCVAMFYIFSTLQRFRYARSFTRCQVRNVTFISLECTKYRDISRNKYIVIIVGNFRVVYFVKKKRNK